MVLEKDKIYNGKELAEWFQISYSTFRQNKKKRLEELKEYADFEEVGVRIKILEVYSNIYVNKRGSGYKIVYQLVKDLWAKNGYDTCAHIYELIKGREDLSYLSESTIYAYVNKAHRERFGSPAKQDGGTEGICYFKWGKRDLKECKKPLYFTKEEYGYFRELILKIYAIDPDEVAEKEAIRQSYAEHEITKEEYEAYLENYENNRKGKWGLIEQGMYEEFNILLIKATQEDFERYNSKKGFIQ